MCKLVVIMLTAALCLSDTPLFPVARGNELSPPLSISLEEFENSYTIASICRAIEQTLSPDQKKPISSIYDWIIKSPNPGIKITPSIHEIIIDIPDESLAVRYFVPGRSGVVTPYSDVAQLKTKVINPNLCRQIIHRTIPNS